MFVFTLFLSTDESFLIEAQKKSLEIVTHVWKVQKIVFGNPKQIAKRFFVSSYFLLVACFTFYEARAPPARIPVQGIICATLPTLPES